MATRILISPRRSRRDGFTLVELMVVIIIIGLLASLTLAGLAGVRQRAKIDKTRSTIRKIHELIVPHYEGFIRRRVPMTGGSGPKDRLLRARQLVMFEIPDSWDDVGGGDEADPQRLVTKQTNGGIGPSLRIPSFAWNGVTQGYAAHQKAVYLIAKAKDQNNRLSFRDNFPSSECLYMVVSRGLGEPDVMEQFRSDEIGDVDGDGAPEFVDGWGQPIAFIRWPVGFESAIQSQDASVQPDPFDPFRVSTPEQYPIHKPPQPDYAVIPLIISGGPEGASTQYGIAFGDVPWHTMLTPPNNSTSIRVYYRNINDIAGFRKDATAAADNITNHDLISK